MRLFRKRRFYEAAEAHQRAERERRRRERSVRRRFLESVLTQRNLVGAFASFAIQSFAAPFGLFPPWAVVIGVAPFYLMILLVVTSLIWARGVWFPPEEEEARRAERAAERAAESARHEAEIEAAKNIQPPPIVQWALRRGRR